MASVREDLEQALREYEEEERKRRERELLKEATKGFVQGLAGATYDIANGATFGGVGKLDKKYFNSTMHGMNNELEKNADYFKKEDEMWQRAGILIFSKLLNQKKMYQMWGLSRKIRTVDKQ